MSLWFPCSLLPSLDVQDDQFDCVVVVTDTIDKLTGNLEVLKTPLQEYANADKSFGSGTSLIVTSVVPSGRVVFSATGPLNRDCDDVRRFYDAGVEGIKRALATGSRKPLFVRPIDDSFPLAGRVATLGALHALYVPLEIRESGRMTHKADVMGVWCNDMDKVTKGIEVLEALEMGRIAARDIGGSDPERTAPPRVLEYVQQMFVNTPVEVTVTEGQETFEQDFPLFAAVNRAAAAVERHQGRLIHLKYVGEGETTSTLCFVGKGVTYDTGGADIKAGGVMAGMHRDKCGAAAVAGFFQVLAQTKPKNMTVHGVMAMVRNSVGEECYVADEIITSRAGTRVRVGNTDAEGRMAMSDALCLLKEKALEAVNPHLFTIATLTGHVIIAFGDQYTAVMSNGPAAKEGTAQQLQAVGDTCADPFEISTIRREDYAFCAAPSEYEDVLQCNNAASSRTPRGHQFPAAFMIRAAGLDKHGVDSDKPLKYSHLDIAGSSGPFPGVPTGSPILALAHKYIL